jgi:hypothetical protein
LRGHRKFSERYGNSPRGWGIDRELLVSAAKVLHERVPSDDHLCGPVSAQPTHRSQPVLELAVIGLDRIVGMSFDVMPRVRHPFLEHAGVVGGAMPGEAFTVRLRALLTSRVELKGPSEQHERPPVSRPQFEAVLGLRYRLQQQLGGGIGAVWRCVDEVLGHTVAAKVLPPTLLDDAGFSVRFQIEARVMAGFRHAGVADIYDYGVDPSAGAYLIMEYVEGNPLSRLIGRLTPARAMSLVAQAADTFHAVHATRRASAPARRTRCRTYDSRRHPDRRFKRRPGSPRAVSTTVEI